MSSSSSPPLPFLPIEVKKEILKFCDQPTLARTSSLSLAFLQLSSPLLYRHIVFEGPEGLTKFLTLAAKKRHPELAPWLDLSLVYSITYVDVKDRPFNRCNRVKPALVPHRLLLPSSSTPGRLSLQSLKAVLPADYSTTRLDPFFNPVEFKLEGTRVLGKDFSSLDVHFYSWTRLRQLVFTDAFFLFSLLSAGCGIDESMQLDGTLHISYQLSQLEESEVNWIASDLQLSEWHKEKVAPIEEVIVYLGTEEEKSLVLGKLVGSVLFPRITVLVKSSSETAADDATTI